MSSKNKLVAAITSADLARDGMAAILKLVDGPLMDRIVKDISGENEITIDGVKVRILSRNTFTPGLEHSVRYLEDFYTSIGVAHKRHEYVVDKNGYPRLAIPTDTHKCLNLIAEIPGDVSPEKVIFVGSHIDSQCGFPHTQEFDAPGFDDCGTGTGATMMIASILMSLKAAGVKIPFTVRFGHFSGEEQGLRGSGAYVKSLGKADIKIMYMLEMMGYTGDGTNRVDLHDSGDPTSHTFAKALIDGVSKYSLNLKPVNYNRPVPSRPSDHFSFLRANHPAICISEDSSDQGLNPKMHSTGDTSAMVTLSFWVEVVRMVTAGVVTAAGVTLPVAKKRPVTSKKRSK